MMCSFLGSVHEEWLTRLGPPDQTACSHWSTHRLHIPSSQPCIQSVQSTQCYCHIYVVGELHILLWCAGQKPHHLCFSFTSVSQLTFFLNVGGEFSKGTLNVLRAGRGWDRFQHGKTTCLSCKYIYHFIKACATVVSYAAFPPCHVFTVNVGCVSTRQRREGICSCIIN